MVTISPIPALDGEIWRDAPRYEGLYRVSSRGRVLSVPRIAANGRSVGGLLKPQLWGPKGYEYLGVTLCSGSRETNWPIKIHQLVMLVFVGPPPEGKEVRHLDGNRYRNHWPENLEYATHVVNQGDMLGHGTAHLAIKVGSQRLNSKLTEELVPVIRAEYAAGATELALAAKYGVNGSTMHRLLARQTWKHVA